MSGKFKFFQGQGIVREFYVVSVKNGYLLKCQGNVREFYNFQFVSNDEKQKTLLGQFSYHIGYKLNHCFNIRRCKELVPPCIHSCLFSSHEPKAQASEVHILVWQ